MSRNEEFDIKAQADAVTALFDQRRGMEALQRLEQIRTGQPQVIQDALDRFIAPSAAPYLEAPGIVAPASAAFAAALERLERAKGAPTLPALNEMTALASDAQRYDVYASIVLVRGTAAAANALDRQQRVILGLRQENSTLAASTREHPAQLAVDDPATPGDDSRRGTGIYNDRIVVLWKDANGTRHLETMERANTEPTARYDAHARPTPARASTPYANVSFRRAEGMDVNGDGTADLGRLAGGTIEMHRTTHGQGGNTHVAFRPTEEAVRRGQGQVQRDTNADGWFNQADINGVQDLNDTFKIHMGSREKTDSAGCQTIHRDDYGDFLAAATGNPAQTRWQYVLTSTTPGQAVRAELDRVPGAERQDAAPPRPQQGARPDQPPAAPQGRLQGQPPGREGSGSPSQGAAHPDHPDHAMLQQLRGLVRGLDAQHGREYDALSEQLSHALLPVAKRNGMTRVDHLILNRGDGQTRPAENLFLVQGTPGDPAALRAVVKTEAAVNTPLQESAAQLRAVNQEIEARHVASTQQPPAHRAPGPVLG